MLHWAIAHNRRANAGRQRITIACLMRINDELGSWASRPPGGGSRVGSSSSSGAEICSHLLIVSPRKSSIRVLHPHLARKTAPTSCMQGSGQNAPSGITARSGSLQRGSEVDRSLSTTRPFPSPRMPGTQVARRKRAGPLRPQPPHAGNAGPAPPSIQPGTTPAPACGERRSVPTKNTSLARPSPRMPGTQG